MFKRVTIFHFFGFEVKADASWLFLSVLIVWMMATKVYPGIYPQQTGNVYQLMGILTLAGLFTSILVHEVAHAVIAEHYQMPVASITLFIFGGVAEMHGEPSHPKGEFLMAIAGPIMSCLLGLVLLASAKVWGMDIIHNSIYYVLRYLGILNIALGVSNMIPAFPLDGGRALRAILWQVRRNFVVATRIAAGLGEAFAYVLIAYACYEIVIHNNMVMGMWYGIFGFFIQGTNTYAVRQAESRALLRREKVSRFMNARVATVPPDLTIRQFVDQFIYEHYQRSFPVIDGEKLAGIITLQSVLALDRAKWPWLHVASVMIQVTQENTVELDSNAATALDLMQRLHKDSLVVVQEGIFKGVVFFADLAAYLSVTMRIDHDKPVTSSRGI